MKIFLSVNLKIRFFKMSVLQKAACILRAELFLCCMWLQESVFHCGVGQDKVFRIKRSGCTFWAGFDLGCVSFPFNLQETRKGKINLPHLFLSLPRYFLFPGMYSFHRDQLQDPLFQLIVDLGDARNNTVPCPSPNMIAQLQLTERFLLKCFCQKTDFFFFASHHFQQHPLSLKTLNFVETKHFGFFFSHRYFEILSS